MADTPDRRTGLRVAVDWRSVGRPRHDATSVASYQRSLATALAEGATPGDDVWALISWPGAADLLQPGIGHIGIGRRPHDQADALRTVGADVAVYAQVAPTRAAARMALVIHDALPATHPEWLGDDERGRTRERTADSLGRAAAVIVTSETARVDVLSVFAVPEARVSVVPPAPAAVFGYRAGAAQRVASRIGPGSYCVAIGDVAARGNLDQLALAVARVWPRLRVISTAHARGPRRDASGIEFVGALADQDRADLLCAAEFAGCVAFADGCGIGALEALACGTPLIVSDRGALGEVAGGAALVVPPTINAIADGIRAIGEPGIADRLRLVGPERAAGYSLGRLAAGAWGALRPVPETRPNDPPADV
jgi:glycosyltransferase involved in cell wall biosynthesis